MPKVDKIPKVRVMLSITLLEAIIAELGDSEHSEEINKAIKVPLFKLGTGITAPTYIATKVELTLEQKIAKGIANEEEIIAYEKQLMESI